MILRHQQNAVGEDVRPDIQHHFVAAKLRLIVDQPRARIGRHGWVPAAGRSLRPRCSRDRSCVVSFQRSGDDAVGFRPERSRRFRRSRESAPACNATSWSNCRCRRTAGIEGSRRSCGLAPDGCSCAPNSEQLHEGREAPHRNPASPWPSPLTTRCSCLPAFSCAKNGRARSTSARTASSGGVVSRPLGVAPARSVVAAAVRRPPARGSPPRSARAARSGSASSASPNSRSRPHTSR